MKILLLMAVAIACDDVDDLVRKLDHDDPDMRVEARDRLIEIGPAVTARLNAVLPKAQGEVRQRIQEILDSPYTGLSPKAIASIRPLEKRADELFKTLTVEDGAGGHGSYHESKPSDVKELELLLSKLPTYRGAARILLRAIDDVYLRFHSNGYHGWSWHYPYFDCVKAMKLADRLLKDHPESAEEALWTKVFCYRIGGPDEKRYPEVPQAGWRADAEKARVFARELIERFPGGKYKKRAAALLEEKEILIGLPTSPGGGDPPVIDRR